MKVAFPYPSYWPYVRRGAERCIHDLACYLGKKKHDVEIITSTPGKPCTRFENNGEVKITYLRQINHPLMYQYLPRMRIAAYGVDATRHLVKNRPDIAHLMSFSQISCAPALRRWLDVPFAFHVIMTNHYWETRYRRYVFSQLVRRADIVFALSRSGAEAITAEFGVPCEVLPPPVDTEHFKPTGQRDPNRPIVLFPADIADARKGAMVLFKAWNRVHAECPSAVLALAGPVGMAGYSQDRGAKVFRQMSYVRGERARAGIELWGPGDRKILPRWYSEAAVTVLPSVEEAFGMVLAESLACGTPVVGSAFDGPGEIISDARIGATVGLHRWADLGNDNFVDELAEAILRGIELSRNPATVALCRSHADQWSLERVGAKEEMMLSAIVDSRRRPRRFAA